MSTPIQTEEVTTEVDPEVEGLRRELEAVKADLDTTRGTLTAREADLAGAQHTLLRDAVARETGVNSELLKGNTRAELEAHADSMKAWAQTQRRTAGYIGRQARSGLAGFSVPSGQSAREGAAEAVRGTF
ncbi:hypothetical protein O1W68_07710 [Rhodococcus sp. H36-A4]|uniref:hypothetical protein n=1 Tax=Rhodococcus sp. H36-A4 TaxID=3004353 RepID=UPI0022B03515|nr:hypothetical protein [Rhodococcus sp. H36-A4]MCZ4077821.1 hypothetical protein [Rhodococcus sp. H36-A4]